MVWLETLTINSCQYAFDIVNVRQSC
jgi:hypothetical protein